MRTQFVCLVTLLAACGDNVTPDQAPIISAERQTTLEDTPLDLAIAASDADGDPVDVTVDGAKHGALVQTPAGWRYTPEANYHGVDVVQVVASDGERSARAFVEIAVGAVNDAPLGVPETFTMVEDEALRIPASVLLENDSDGDGDALVLTGVGPATGGEVSLEGDEVVFVPAANFHGAATFTYTVSDGTASADVTDTATVGGVNDAPKAQDDALAIDEDSELVIDAARLVANDSDADSHHLWVSKVSGAHNGRVSLGHGQITFTPDPNFNGDAQFMYVVTDGSAEATGAVAVTVRAVNDAPVAAPLAFTTDEDLPLTIPVADLTGGAADVDGDALAVTAVYAEHGATVALVGDSIIVTPDANFHGGTGFTYLVSDGTATVKAEAAIAVGSVNDAPIAPDVALTIPEDTMATFPDLAAGVTDADGDRITVTDIRAAGPKPLWGTLDAQAGTFMPEQDYDGVQRMLYTVTDGTTTATGTITVEITPVEDGPSATDDGGSFHGVEDVPLIIPAASLLANDTDADYDELTIVSVEGASGGTVALADGVITFTPRHNFHGPGRFTYTITDGQLTSSAMVGLSFSAVVDCGDGEKDVSEACDDGNTDDNDGCSATCQIESCGDHIKQTDEQCDDGNTADNDGCNASCEEEYCGDGIQQTAEECDDGGTDDGDGCDATCHNEKKEFQYVTTETTKVNNAVTEGCSLISGDKGKKVVADSAGNVYVAMTCNEGIPMVAHSSDGGLTFASPWPVGITNVSAFSLAIGGDGTVQAAVVSVGHLLTIHSADHGGTWSLPVDLGPAMFPAVSMVTHEQQVWIAVRNGPLVDVHYNSAGGTGEWSKTMAHESYNTYELLRDERNGQLIVAAADDVIHMVTSSDDGQTWGLDTMVEQDVSEPAFALGGGMLYTASSSGMTTDHLNYLSLDDLTLSGWNGFPYLSPASGQRSLAADPNGVAYVATATDDGVTLLRRDPSFGIDVRRSFAMGTHASVSMLPVGNGVAMAYDSKGDVYVTIQTYETSSSN